MPEPPAAETHPVQMPTIYPSKKTRLPTTVTMQAYEVYCHVYAPQEALVTGGCRGGFGIFELVAFLYAYPHPREEWRARVDEVFKNAEGMK